MSSSSRPSSSLSQRSSCAGDEQRERQVSHELEQFEAASLHCSLPRRRCRDPRASSHFAINPLLHLEVDARSTSASDNSNATRATDSSATTTTTTAAETEGKNRADLRGLWVEEPSPPRYNDCEGSPGDSGMCSIGSRDSELGSERDRWRRVYRLEDGDQISSVGGRRFYTTGYKYHTFGGIWTRPAEDLKDLDDFDDESASLDDRLTQSDRAPEFTGFKFQTFGGIKRSRRRIDGKRIRLKPPIPFKLAGSRSRDSPKRTARSADEEQLVRCCSSLERFESFEHSTSSALEKSDWQDEEDDVANVVLGLQSSGSTARDGSRRNVVRMKRRISSRRKNANAPAGEIIMDKFLKDVSSRRKVYAFGDKVATSQRRRFRRRREIPEEGVDENLEKPTTGNNEGSLESSEGWKGSRRARGRKDDNKRRRDNLDVRSLSDVTIW